MACLHDTFRRALGDAPGQIASVQDGDAERAQQVASYLSEVLWFLHAHHEGEDDLLYPLLAERAPEARELFSRMESQHVAVAASIEFAEQATERFGKSGSTDDGDTLGAACRALLAEAAGHLTEEEVEVLPIASRTITPAEWGALPGHVLGQYQGTRPWLLLGLATKPMPDDLRDNVFSHVPPPVAEMWFGFGSAAFTKEMVMIPGARPE